MGLFDRFKKNTGDANLAPKPGPNEKIVIFNDLGMR